MNLIIPSNMDETMNPNQCVLCQKKIDVTFNFLCPYCGSSPIEQNIYEAMIEMTNLVEKLNNKVNVLREHFKTLNLPPIDERNQTLGALSFLLMWLNHQLITHSEVSSNPKAPLIQKILGENPTISSQTLITMIGTFDAFNRRSFLAEFMFIIEVFLESVNKILKTQTNDHGYKNLVKHVLRELGMLQADGETYRTLYFPAIVRNSMHMSGVHTINPDNGKISGILFKFEKGKFVQYGGWRNIYFFCDKILESLEKILKNEEIEKTPIPTLKINT